MPFEIIEDRAGMNAPMGTFTPQAPQEKYSSAFGCVGGNRKPGWIDGRSLEQGVPTQDGRGLLKFVPYKDEKGKHNIIKHEGMDVQEYVALREDADKKTIHDANISNRKVANYAEPTSSPATANNIGRSSVMEQLQDVRTTVPHDS